MKKGRALPPEARKLAAAVKWPLLGFLLCGGQVAGLYAPFALAAVAVAGIRLAGLGAVLGVAGGAFVFMDFQSGLRCAAAAILIFAANTALYDTAVYKKPYFRPACTAVFFLLVQSIYLLGRSASSWLLALCAGAAAAGAAWLRERKLENWGFLCGLALALLPVSAYGFSLGRVALMALLLAAGRGCSVSQCAALGGCLGLLADLTATEPVVLLALYEKYTCLRFTELITHLDKRQLKRLNALKTLMLRFQAFGTVTPANLSRWHNVKQIYAYLLEVNDIPAAIQDISNKVNILAEHQQETERARSETVINIITIFGIVSILASVLSIVQILSNGDIWIWMSTILTTLAMLLITIIASRTQRK